MRSIVDPQSPALAQLMGAYFHQDWYDAGTEDDVVEKFLRDAPDVARRLPEEIDTALSTHADEGSLRSYLRSLGCAYNPTRRYGGARAWLQEVGRQARAHLQGE
jgi:CdiI immunity protein